MSRTELEWVRTWTVDVTGYTQVLTEAPLGRIKAIRLIRAVSRYDPGLAYSRRILEEGGRVPASLNEMTVEAIAQEFRDLGVQVNVVSDLMLAPVK